MDDSEIVKRCAEAMGLCVLGQATALGTKIQAVSVSEDGTGRCAYIYNPLVNDAQAMEMLKAFEFVIAPERKRGGGGPWGVTLFAETGLKGRGRCVHAVRDAPDLNRAICECVARMQSGAG